MLHIILILAIKLLKELGHHISDHDAINSTAILFLPYKEVISLDYCQFKDCGCSDLNCDRNSTL